MEGEGKTGKVLATPTTATMYSGEVSLMAAMMEVTNAASPLLKQSRERVEGVEEGVGVPLTEGIRPRHDDDSA
jgi:division protein CdvB (Snf7/Vps24/ESCRT-III family)